MALKYRGQVDSTVSSIQDYRGIFIGSGQSNIQLMDFFPSIEGSLTMVREWEPISRGKPEVFAVLVAASIKQGNECNLLNWMPE